jgi:hypothetical protein
MLSDVFIRADDSDFVLRDDRRIDDAGEVGLAGRDVARNKPELCSKLQHQG